MAFSKFRQSLRNNVNEFHNQMNSFPHYASCGLFAIGDGTVSHMFQKWPILGCTLEVADNGTDSDRATITRIAGGALIAGGTGAIIGGLAKKSNAAGYMTLTTPEGVRQMKLRGKEVQQAKTFEMKFHLEQERAAARA